MKLSSYFVCNRVMRSLSMVSRAVWKQRLHIVTLMQQVQSLQQLMARSLGLFPYLLKIDCCVTCFALHIYQTATASAVRRLSPNADARTSRQLQILDMPSLAVNRMEMKDYSKVKAVAANKLHRATNFCFYYFVLIFWCFLVC